MSSPSESPASDWKPRFDHLVVAATTLASGINALESLLQVPLTAGGQHLQMGTHNALLRLGESCYLEVIAIDPSLPAPPHNRWFGLDDPAVRARLALKPCLLHWVARTDDIDLACRKTSPPYGRVISMMRGELQWRITVADDGSLPGNGILPSLIQWSVHPHPATGLPDRGCRLLKMEAATPKPDPLRRQLGELNLQRCLTLRKAVSPQLKAWIETPNGVRLLE